MPSAVRHDLVVLLAGQPGPVRELLEAHRPLAARFAAVIGFPGYEGRDLGAVFAWLAVEAGFRLGDGAQARAVASWTPRPTASGGAPGWWCRC